MRHQERLQLFEGLLRRVDAAEKIQILLVNRSPVDERPQIEHLVPVLASVEDDEELLRELAGLRQRQDLEHLVERAEAAGKDHERLRQVREPELPHEEVVELEVQIVGDVLIGSLLEGKSDVEPDGLAAGLVRSAVGRLHDAGTSPGAYDEPPARRLE